MTEVQFLPGALAARVHVDGSQRCSTTVEMTGVRSPLSRSRSGIGLDSKSELAEFNSLAACGSSADCLSGSKREQAGVNSRDEPKPEPVQHRQLARRSPGGDVGFICRTRRVRFSRAPPTNLVATSSSLVVRSTRCSEVVSRLLREQETAGSIPVTPTTFNAACARERCPIEEKSRRCTSLFDGFRGENPRCGTFHGGQFT